LYRFFFCVWKPILVSNYLFIYIFQSEENMALYMCEDNFDKCLNVCIYSNKVIWYDMCTKPILASVQMFIFIPGGIMAWYNCINVFCYRCWV
jgi:hypothetical protein